MSVVNQQAKSRKNVLQQSNYIVDSSREPEEEEDHKLLSKNREEMLETENRIGSKKKSTKSDTIKLRSVRLDLSSLRRAVIQKSDGMSTQNGFSSDDGAIKSPRNDFTSDESSEDESSKKQKVRPVVPNYVTNSDSGPCRKPRKSRQDPTALSSQNSPKLKESVLQYIVRRNARERNRVKQINEGFAALRSRIPKYISKEYNKEKGRKTEKKLSKVETLRMAVDYIRHLETLLDLRSEDDVAKAEALPWDTPESSMDYPSPAESKYQPSSVGSPGPSYDQSFDYQDKILYDYDLDFMPRVEGIPTNKRLENFNVIGEAGPETKSVDDFKYYETFNRLKKDVGDETEEGKMVTEDENEDGEDLENSDMTNRPSDGQLLPKNKDVIKKVSKKSTVLPSITESFSKGIPVFF